jgi:deferrochelatase/peroxidase EfeB
VHELRRDKVHPVFLLDEAHLLHLPGFAGMTDVRLASLLVGRWPSGAPVARAPGGDVPELGEDPRENNSFLFDVDTPSWKLTSPAGKTHDTAKADPVGLVCPVAAHIRKVNLRDSSSDIGGATATQTRRLLRVGIPFGPPLPDKARYGDAPDPAGGNRGLLFLARSGRPEWRKRSVFDSTARRCIRE